MSNKIVSRYISLSDIYCGFCTTNPFYLTLVKSSQILLHISMSCLTFYFIMALLGLTSAAPRLQSWGPWPDWLAVNRTYAPSGLNMNGLISWLLFSFFFFERERASMETSCTHIMFRPYLEHRNLKNI